MRDRLRPLERLLEELIEAERYPVLFQSSTSEMGDPFTPRFRVEATLRAGDGPPTSVESPKSKPFSGDDLSGFSQAGTDISADRAKCEKELDRSERGVVEPWIELRRARNFFRELPVSVSASSKSS
jgi:hypothetical protein